MHPSGKQSPGDLVDILQVGQSLCQVNPMDHKNKIKLSYITAQRAGLLLSSAKDFMIFKELFPCPSAASTADKQSNKCSSSDLHGINISREELIP